jgi:hypothetical protein
MVVFWSSPADRKLLVAVLSRLGVGAGRLSVLIVGQDTTGV